MTPLEQRHCDQVFKCLAVKRPAEDKVGLEILRPLINEVAIISAKLALLTLEPPKLSGNDESLLKTILDAVDGNIKLEIK